MKMAPNEMTAFWLMPAREERDYFASLIADLARRFDAPVFEPHVTLFGGQIAEAAAIDVLQQSAARAPIELEVERIEFSEKFTKTVFVPISPFGGCK